MRRPGVRGVLLGMALAVAMTTAGGAQTTSPDTVLVRSPAAHAPADSAARRVPSAADTARALQDRARRLPPPGPTGFDRPRWVMLRSLAIPGWGQVHNGSWWKAVGVAAAEGYLVARIIEDSRALDRLSADVDRAFEGGNVDAILLASERYNERSNQFVGRQWFLGGVLAYALLDAYIDAHFRDFQIEFERDPALPAGASGTGGVRISWQEKF